MKKLCLFAIIGMLAACDSPYRFPGDVTADAVGANHQVVYSPAAGVWSNGSMAEDRIVFTKHISAGSGSYSEYKSPEQELYLSSTYEFLSNGRLIGYSGHELKFYELKYIKDGVWQVELTPEQVAELFPGLEIIRTSSAKDGIIEVERRPFGTKTVLLLNDTPASYYHYSFENFEHSGEPFKSVLRLNDARDIVFSHFGKADEANPILILRVKNKL